MDLILEHDDLPRENFSVRGILGQEVVEAISVERSVGPQPPESLLLHYQLV